MIIDFSHTDPKTLKVRRHRIAVQMSLLGGCDVVSTWWWQPPHSGGQRRDAYEHCDSFEQAERVAIKLTKRRLRSGYKLLSHEGIPEEVFTAPRSRTQSA